MLVHLIRILIVMFVLNAGIAHFKCPVQVFLSVLYSKNKEHVH